jgi:hypothetical protein
VETLRAAVPGINREVRQELAEMLNTRTFRPGFKEKFEQAVREADDSSGL